MTRPKEYRVIKKTLGNGKEKFLIEYNEVPWENWKLIDKKEYKSLKSVEKALDKLRDLEVLKMEIVLDGLDGKKKAVDLIFENEQMLSLLKDVYDTHFQFDPSNNREIRKKVAESVKAMLESKGKI